MESADFARLALGGPLLSLWCCSLVFAYAFLYRLSDTSHIDYMHQWTPSSTRAAWLDFVSLVSDTATPPRHAFRPCRPQPRPSSCAKRVLAGCCGVSWGFATCYPWKRTYETEKLSATLQESNYMQGAYNGSGLSAEAAIIAIPFV